MEIYIEYAILDNLLIDYLLLKETAVFLKINAKRLQLFLSSIIGVVVAVVLPLFKINELLLFFIKIFSAMLMCFFATSHKNVKAYLLYFNVFLLATFLLGGACFGVLSILGINYSIQAYYQAKILPVGLTIFLGYCFIVLTKRFVKDNIKGSKIAKTLIKCKIVVDGISFPFNAFFDSGNFLKDEKTGLPIVIVYEKVFNNLKSNVFLKEGGNVVVSTANGISSHKCYLIDFIEIDLNGERIRRDAKIIKCNFKPLCFEEGLIGAEIL